MFDRIRKSLAGASKATHKPAEPAAAPASATGHGPLSEWAASQGVSFSPGHGHNFSMQGQIGGRPWRLELGRASRDYVRGQELRARAELGLAEDAAAVVFCRDLKELLEKRAYSHYTDSLQTVADSRMPEEVRWLAMYEEVGWQALPRAFWERYAVLADERARAEAWIDPPLAGLLLNWPEPAPGPELPFMMMVMRGKLYLRMECEPEAISTIQHAVTTFNSACHAALAAMPAGASRT